MGLFDLVSDVVSVASNVSKVVLAPVEVVVKGAKEATKVVVDVVEDVKDTITK